MSERAPSSMDDYADSLDIAIIGMAAQFPHARDIEEYWDLLRSGRSAVTYFSENELLARGVSPELLRDPQYVRAGNILDDIDLFDAAFFGYSPREAELMDPQHRLLLQCAWAALESSGHDPKRYQGLIGVYAGASNNTYLMFNLASNMEIIESVGGNQVMVGNSADFLTTRISYKLGLEGPSITVQTACSTSLVAVVLACQALLGYHCDMALAGGVSIDVLKHHGYLYESDGLYSPDGLCRSFDARAQGTSGGNGVGLVVLKRLYDALADSDHIHAVIRGSAINNDGSRRAGYTAPSADSQALAITTALAVADVDPGTIGFVEAHGTATVLGDPIEVAALNAAFAKRSTNHGPCVLGSVKSNIGHLDAAAGVAGLMKAVLAVEKAQIPPTVHFTTPNPRIDFSSGHFYVNTELVPWRKGDSPRRAGVSSFGLGGTNAHVVLEEAPLVSRPRPPATGGSQILILSARSRAALDTATDRLADHLRRHPDLALADVAVTLALGRAQFSHRRFLACPEVADALHVLNSPEDGQLLSEECAKDGQRPVAFMLTGHGDQYPGMADDLYRREPVFRATVDRCTEYLRTSLGIDIRPDLLGPAAAPAAEPGHGALDFRAMLEYDARADHPLSRPLLGHLAVFIVEYALVELWRSWGVKPDLMIGHSLGEYVAACVAGVFSLEEALTLVEARARLIGEQGEGAMLAVPVDEETASSFVDGDVGLAAVNGPRACVLSGRVAGIERIERELRGQAIASRRLPVRFAPHSPLMRPLVERYGAVVGRITLRPPRIRFVSSATGSWITEAEATDPGYWARHLCGPVLFSAGLAALWAVPSVILVEIGPGQTLSSMAVQHPASRAVRQKVVLPSLPDAFTRQSADATIMRALGRLWLAGVVVDWPAVHSAAGGRRIPLPTYPFERKRFWLEARRQPETVVRADRRADPAAWFYTPSWRRLEAGASQPAADLAGPRWLVFIDEHGVGEQVASQLTDLGASVARVRIGTAWACLGPAEYVLDPGQPAHYRRLAEALRDSGSLPDRVAHFWTVGTDGSADASRPRTEELLARGFYSLVWWAQAAALDLATAVRWDVVSTETARVTGAEALCPARAAVQGFCRVAPQEYPSLQCRHVDISWPPPHLSGDTTRPVLAELARPVRDDLVALRGGHRWGQTYLPIPDPGDGPSILRPGGVYLITGGLGRIGLTIARSLASAVRARLVLVGRTGLPPADAWDQPRDWPASIRSRIAAVRELEASGAEVVVCAADASDADQMRAVVTSAVERFGALNGIVHAAGLTGEHAHRVLSELDTEQSERHFQPKLYGVQALEHALAGQAPDFVMLCSSLSPLLGGLGLSAYAAANAALDAYALRRGAPWISVNWEGWQFPGDEITSSQPGASVQEAAITPQEGASVFMRLVTADPERQIVISTTGLEQRARLWANPAGHSGAPAPDHPRPNLANPYVAPQSEEEEQVAGIWRELLGVDKAGVNDNFFELGGTSLLGVQVIHKLRRACELPVPLTAVYEGPTIRSLAGIIANIKGGR